MKTDDKLPIRDLNHIIGDRALDVFNYNCLPQWIRNESRRDYGWDLLVNIAINEKVREHFFIQLKGSQSPNYIENDTIISFQLKVKTINFLLMENPAMLCLCHVDIDGNKDEPVYYVWIDAAVAEIKEKNSNWRSQEDVNIHIPVKNIFNRNACRNIETHVITCHKNFKIRETIGKIFLPALGKDTTDALYASQEEPINILSQGVTPLKEAGIVFQGTEDENFIVLLPKQQEFNRKLLHVSKLLNERRDKETRELISKLADNVDLMPDELKASYYNHQGIYYLHVGDSVTAVSYFDKAHKLFPGEYKYLANKLLTEFVLADESSSFEDSLPDTWEEQLNNIFQKCPNSCHLLRLKALWLSKKKNAQAAESLLRASECWQKEPEYSRYYLVIIYNNSGDIVNTERLLNEIQNLESSKIDALFWSLYGYILLKKALGVQETTTEFVIKGSGPSLIDIELLGQAENCFEQAFQEFREKKFPCISLETVVNYALICRLLGDFEKEKNICEMFLEVHPENALVNAALAGCLAKQPNRISQAIHYAEIAYDSQSTSTNFINLATCYFDAEDFDKLLQFVSEREKKGFHNDDEKGISLLLSAVACNEIGERQKAHAIIASLKSEPQTERKSVLAEAIIAQKDGASNESVIGIYRKALTKYPDDIDILTHYVKLLLPNNPDNAKEIIHCITTIRKQRQLVRKEILLLEQAYLRQEELGAADQIMESAIVRYPNESDFLYERAKIQFYLGNEELSFQLLHNYLETGSKDYTTLHNLAWLASETDRLDEAIKFFELSLSKIVEKKERGTIHCQLYELRKKRNDSPKKILYHAMEFGKTVENTEQEAQFLTMFILAPYISQSDEEVKNWFSEVTKRQVKFSKEYPQFPPFQSFSIPDNIPEEQYGVYLKAKLTEIMLPYEIASAPLKLATKTCQFPLFFRVNLYDVSFFAYWQTCTESDKFEHAIHIYHSNSNLMREKEIIRRSSIVCIDLTALLTLTSLNILDSLKGKFDKIIIVRGTKNALRHEFYGLNQPHALAEKLEDWRLKNRDFIRVRTVRLENEDVENDQYVKNSEGIFLRQKHHPNEVMTHGVGESILLAQKLKIAFYTDESSVRQWANEEFNVDTFCSLSFLEYLWENKVISIEQEAAFRTEMIKKNFHQVPFRPEHLQSQLERLWREAQNNEVILSQEAIRTDPILGVFIKQFGDSSIPEDTLILTAMRWWQMILQDEKFNNDLLVKCMLNPLYSFSMKTQSSILTGIQEYEQEVKAAYILAFFIWFIYKQHVIDIAKVWSCVKDCINQLFHNSKLPVSKILYSVIPKSLFKIVWTDNSVEQQNKLHSLIQIPCHFPSEDRIQFEEALVRDVQNLR